MRNNNRNECRNLRDFNITNFNKYNLYKETLIWVFLKYFLKCEVAGEKSLRNNIL